MKIRVAFAECIYKIDISHLEPIAVKISNNSIALLGKRAFLEKGCFRMYNCIAFCYYEKKNAFSLLPLLSKATFILKLLIIHRNHNLIWRRLITRRLERMITK